MAVVHLLVVRRLRLCRKVHRCTPPLPPRYCRPPPSASLTSSPLLLPLLPPSPSPSPSSTGSALPPSPPALVATAPTPLSFSPPFDPTMPLGSTTRSRLPLRRLHHCLPCPSQPPSPLPHWLCHPLHPRGLSSESSPFAEAIPVFAIEHHARVLCFCGAHLCSPLLLRRLRRPLRHRRLPCRMPRPSPKETRCREKKKQATLELPFSPSSPSSIPYAITAFLAGREAKTKEASHPRQKTIPSFDHGPQATVGVVVHRSAHRPRGL